MNKELRDKFIVDNISNYWKEKIEYYSDIIKTYIAKGIKVTVSNGKVVEIHNGEELDTEQKHEIASSTEGLLFAEGQYEIAGDSEE